jgi:hypothetical protein
VNLEIDEFLSPTPLCDFEHEAVVAKVNSMHHEATSTRQLAILVFEFVRDSVRHEWVSTVQSASTTLETRRGDCWPKSILQVALLRAAGIPARFRWFEYRKTAFRKLVPPFVYQRLADPFPFHAAAEVYLDDQWLLADATFDRQLSPARAGDWNGEGHHLVFSADEITRDLGFTASFEQRVPIIDEFFAARGDEAGVGIPEDVETDIVNMNFELIRLRNRLNAAP